MDRTAFAAMEKKVTLSWLLAFSDEPKEEQIRITAHYAALRRNDTPKPLEIKSTLGRFMDGVL